MRHPFEAISPARRAAVFWPLAAFAILMTAVMQVAGAPLKTGAAPGGIISFEFAGTTAQAAAILASWDPTQQLHAAFSLGIDYLYMAAYGAAIAMGCVAAGGMVAARRFPLGRWGWWLAWAVWLAVVCDAVENVALLRLLYGPVADPWPALAAGCAGVKCALIALGLAYSVYGAGAWVARRRYLDLERAK